jgi:hypothetical protein
MACGETYETGLLECDQEGPHLLHHDPDYGVWWQTDDEHYHETVVTPYLESVKPPDDRGEGGSG